MLELAGVNIAVPYAFEGVFTLLKCSVAMVDGKWYVNMVFVFDDIGLCHDHSGLDGGSGPIYVILKPQ